MASDKEKTKQLHAYEPDYSVPPGETLRETIETLGLTQADLATRAGLSTKHVNQIIQGAATISPDVARRLENATGVTARIWNSLESNYRAQILRIAERAELAKDIDWLREPAVKELIRRGSVRRYSDLGAQLEEVFRFFGVADREAWDRTWSKPQASFRVSKAFDIDQIALAGWLRSGEIEAQEVGAQCAEFDKDKFRAALSSIRGLTTQEPHAFEPRLRELCAQAGVVLALIPEITGARASGAARWLTPTRGIIQLSLRYRWEDHFWFSFFHEAGHILLHGKRNVFIDQPDGSTDEFEIEANKFAQDLLIPPSHDSLLPNLKTAVEIRTFANLIGISPGIVVGRLQRESLLSYNQFNSLRRRFALSSSEN
jgi:HTH-type transcriptional regulator / antitoxin HigA